MISRRSFTLASLSGLLAAAFSRLPFSRRAAGHIKHHAINLFDFCDSDSTACARFSLARPFVRGQYLYATDARVAVRVPTLLRGLSANADEENGKFRLPKIESLGWCHADVLADEWQSWPAADYRFIRRFDSSRNELANCPLCDERPECDKCGGYGEWDAKQCPKCRGKCLAGCWNCLMCHGEREGEFPVYQLIGDRIIHRRYHERIARLPNVRWWTAPHVADAAVYFVFDNGPGEMGEGIVMPIAFTAEELAEVYGLVRETTQTQLQGA